MYKVMIVDDVEIFRRVFKRLNVWDSGFTIVEEARDGLDALDKLESVQIDLVFVDIKMPCMDGIELLRIISERKLAPCVVLLSDYTEYAYARQGILYGVFDYVSKDIEETELRQLLDRVRRYLEQRYRQEQKLIRLEEFMEETYSSSIDVAYIAQCICHGEDKVYRLISEMIDSMEGILYNDNNRALLILKNTLLDILNQILKQYEWLPLFYNIRQFHDFHISNCDDWNKIQEAVHTLIEELLSVIRRFLPCHDNTIIKNTCEYILVHIHEELSVRYISEKMYISKAHLSEIFKHRIGITLLEYITMAKMERAKQLLRDADKKNYEVALQLSYRDYSYFNKVFKKYTGVPFSVYRKQYLRKKQ